MLKTEAEGIFHHYVKLGRETAMIQVCDDHVAEGEKRQGWKDTLKKIANEKSSSSIVASSRS